MVQYAVKRFKDQVHRFTRLYDMILAARSTRPGSPTREQRHDFFQEIDYRVYFREVSGVSNGTTTVRSRPNSNGLPIETAKTRRAFGNRPVLSQDSEAVLRRCRDQRVGNHTRLADQVKPDFSPSRASICPAMASRLSGRSAARSPPIPANSRSSRREGILSRALVAPAYSSSSTTTLSHSGRVSASPTRAADAGARIDPSPRDSARDVNRGGEDPRHGSVPPRPTAEDVVDFNPRS